MEVEREDVLKNQSGQPDSLEHRRNESVTHPAWSKFTNRFALSPLPPLSTLNSDGGGGITYSNTWDIDIPYDGFYGVKGTADNAGRVLIDGQRGL